MDSEISQSSPQHSDTDLYEVEAPAPLTPTAHSNEDPVASCSSSGKRKRRAEEQATGATRAKKRKNHEVVDEQKEKIRKSRRVTELYKKVVEKIRKLERLTPTWSWKFEIEKNCYNTRSTKHKYSSADKSSDLSKRVRVDRISRYWNGCLTAVKDIEKLDENFFVTIRATQPESESRKKNIHQYESKVESESEEEIAASSESSDEALGSQEIGDDGFFLSCRMCRD